MDRSLDERSQNGGDGPQGSNTGRHKLTFNSNVSKKNTEPSKRTKLKRPSSCWT